MSSFLVLAGHASRIRGSVLSSCRVPIICLKGKRYRDLYNVTNYLRSPNQNVKLVGYRPLKGAWSETESDDDDWMREMEEDSL